MRAARSGVQGTYALDGLCGRCAKRIPVSGATRTPEGLRCCRCRLEQKNEAEREEIRLERLRETMEGSALEYAWALALLGGWV